MAAPELAARCQTKDLAELAALPLIHLNAESRRWTTWRTWFETLGYSGPLSRGTRVNNYMIALQAAQDSAGLVLGWERLVRPYLNNGTLVSFGQFKVPAPESFFLNRSPATTGDKQVDLVADWLMGDTA